MALQPLFTNKNVSRRCPEYFVDEAEIWSQSLQEEKVLLYIANSSTFELSTMPQSEVIIHIVSETTLKRKYFQRSNLLFFRDMTIFSGRWNIQLDLEQYTLKQKQTLLSKVKTCFSRVLVYVVLWFRSQELGSQKNSVVKNVFAYNSFPWRINKPSYVKLQCK